MATYRTICWCDHPRIFHRREYDGWTCTVGECDCTEWVPKEEE